MDVLEDIPSLSAVLLLLQTAGVRDPLSISGPGPVLEASLPGVGPTALIVSLDGVPLVLDVIDLPLFLFIR